jgi:hypothetical protein
MLQRQQRDADCQHTFAERQHLTSTSTVSRSRQTGLLFLPLAHRAFPHQPRSRRDGRQAGWHRRGPGLGRLAAGRRSAIRERSAAKIRAFEEVFEPLGLTALAIQVLTGLWLG